MLKIVLKQIWNQRKQNVWIFLELLAAGTFLWIILDSLCINYADSALPRGWDDKDVYKVDIKKYSKNNVRYKAEIDSAKLCFDHYMQMFSTLSGMPEIENYAFSWDYPNSGSTMTEFVMCDSAGTAHGMKFTPICNTVYQYGESDYFKVFGLKDALTGEVMSMPSDAGTRKLVYISENLAKSLYGTSDVAGRKVWVGGDNKKDFEIGGVFKIYKARDMIQPVEHIISVYNLSARKTMHNFQLFIKVKDGVNKTDFLSRFNKEIKPKLKVGNYYCSDMHSYKALNREYNEQIGFYDDFRKNTIFVIFGVLCVFLGMVGTFWIRSEARRQENRCNAQCRSVTKQDYRTILCRNDKSCYLAMVIVLAGLAVYVYHEGFFAMQWVLQDKLDPQYWQNNAISHFAVISIVTYLVILLTAVIGTFIPVKQAVRELPADALRDE